MNLSKMLSVCGVLGMMAAPALMANQVTTVGSYGPYQTGQGGEISIKLGTGMDGFAQYYHNSAAMNQVAGALNQPNIQTFCVEHKETVYPNATADVSLSSKTKFGGSELTVGAAYLYYEFADGSLKGYNYSGGTEARKSSADQLQHALWYFMGEDATISSSNPFWALANENGFANRSDYNNGRFGVQVINMWAEGHFEQSGYERQDLLIRTSDNSWSQPPSGGTPVPDAGSTLMLLGAGLTGVGLLRRRVGC